MRGAATEPHLLSEIDCQNGQRFFDRIKSLRLLPDDSSTVRLWNTSFTRWLGPAVILTSLILTAPVAAQNQDGQGGNGQGQNGHGGTWVPTPETATLTLIALGGGAAALGARFRKGRRK